MSVLDIVTVVFLMMTLPVCLFFAYGQLKGLRPKPIFHKRQLLFVLLIILYVIDGLFTGFTVQLLARIGLFLSLLYLTASNS